MLWPNMITFRITLEVNRGYQFHKYHNLQKQVLTLNNDNKCKEDTLKRNIMDKTPSKITISL